LPTTNDSKVFVFTLSQFWFRKVPSRQLNLYDAYLINPSVATNAFIYLSMESFFVKNESRCNLSYIPSKWYLTNDVALLVLTLLSRPTLGFEELPYNHWLFWGQRCNNYQEFIVSVFLRNHLHVKIVQFRFCENFYNDGIINHSWPNYEILLVIMVNMNYHIS